MVDVEANGPIPGDYSMTELGAIVVEPSLDRTFYAAFNLISNKTCYEMETIARKANLPNEEPSIAMNKFRDWLIEVSVGGSPRFISDNNGFDWQFVNWYFHHFVGSNPFGHSSTNLGSLYKGMIKNMRRNFKHLRVTRHSHDPKDDSRGNAEAMLHIINVMGLNL
jgi:hypothetical protein